MKSFAEKYNRGSQFDVDTTDLEYIKPKELFLANGEDAVYGLYAIYINENDKFGKAPVYVTADNMVNIPRHMLEVSEEILNDRDAIEEIKSGSVGFKVTQYYNEKYSKQCYGIEFVDAK